MFLEGSLLVDHSFYFHMGHRSAVTNTVLSGCLWNTTSGQGTAANTCKDTPAALRPGSPRRGPGDGRGHVQRPEAGGSPREGKGGNSFSATPWGDCPHHKTKKPLTQSVNHSQSTELMELRILR
eukprot:bmy_08272T0